MLSPLFGISQNNWDKLSPKQKIKLGKKEQKAAKKDPEYLKLMEDGMAMFRDGNYTEAIQTYEKAHNRRPDNVYPLVMLDDIAIAQKAKNENPVVETPSPPPPEPTPVPEIIVPTEIVETKSEKPLEKKPEKVEEIKVPEKELAASPAKKTTKAQPKKTAPAPPPPPIVYKKYDNDGVYRESFKEGNAQINQVTVVKSGVQTVIREVIHSWGAIYYFNNNTSITKQEWMKLMDEIGNE